MAPRRWRAATAGSTTGKSGCSGEQLNSRAGRSSHYFSPGNDPYEEHDFGALQVAGRQLFWKIDYYGPGFETAADDPADESTCERVLTLMLAEEY